MSIFDYMKKLNIILKDFGLSEFEASIYLNLLRNGASTVLEVSKRTGLNRITTHTNAENLLRKGLLSTIKRKTKRYLIAESPEKIESILRSQELELVRKRELFPELLSILKAEISHPNSKTHFEVRTYEGKTAIESLYDEILVSKEVRAFVNAAEIHRIYPNNFHKFGNASAKGDIEIWDIVENNPYGNLQRKLNNYKNYHIKVLPEGVSVGSMDFLIHDNKITIIEGDLEPVAVVISSPALYINSKSIFDCMWQLLV